IGMAGAILAITLASPAQAADPSGLARVVARKLRTEQTRTPFRPETHTTDFRGEAPGRITLPAGELRDFGYRGHPFFCESAATGEVLGAVLTRSGRVRCFVSGDYTGDGCYSFTICGVPDGACVQ